MCKRVIFFMGILILPFYFYSCINNCGKNLPNNARIDNIFVTGQNSIQSAVDTVIAGDTTKYFVINFEILAYASVNNNPFMAYACSPAGANLQNSHDSLLIVCKDDYNKNYKKGSVLNDSVKMNFYAYRIANSYTGSYSMPVILNQMIQEIYSTNVQSNAIFIKPKPSTAAKVQIVRKRGSNIIWTSKEIIVLP